MARIRQPVDSPLDGGRTLVPAIAAWFAASARPLPWRSPERTPWGVLVSEFMLQQTQVDRVIPYWHEWMDLWPTPRGLAEAPLAEALRRWGRLGYPRRARRLHECAGLIVERHDGQVPSGTDELRALPGVGEYTAAAVRAFAFGIPGSVLDVNVRRVLARAVMGNPVPAPTISAAERSLAAQLAEQDPSWSGAVMELGAIMCTARNPKCGMCPVQSDCAWQLAGAPQPALPARPRPKFAGSNRQARGAIMAELRAGGGALEYVWPDPDQRERALQGLLADGLVEVDPAGGFRLAGG